MLPFSLYREAMLGIRGAVVEMALLATSRIAADIASNCAAFELLICNPLRQFRVSLSGPVLLGSDSGSKLHALRDSALSLPARKWIADCKPIDCLTVSHVLRIKCAGTNMERSRDDE